MLRDADNGHHDDEAARQRGHQREDLGGKQDRGRAERAAQSFARVEFALAWRGSRGPCGFWAGRDAAK